MPVIEVETYLTTRIICSVELNVYRASCSRTRVSHMFPVVKRSQPSASNLPMFVTAPASPLRIPASQPVVCKTQIARQHPTTAPASKRTYRRFKRIITLLNSDFTAGRPLRIVYNSSAEGSRPTNEAIAGVCGAKMEANKK